MALQRVLQRVLATGFGMRPMGREVGLRVLGGFLLRVLRRVVACKHRLPQRRAARLQLLQFSSEFSDGVHFRANEAQQSRFVLRPLSGLR